MTNNNSLKLYNTLTRKKETFSPLLNHTVRMYSCGPTVYNYAHIGNLRTYIFMDIIRRTLKYNGFDLKGVMNITDVGHLLHDSDDGEDKMVQASKAERKTPAEIADYYTEVFFEDIKKLNIAQPEIIVKATDHIQDMVDYVQKLKDAGFAYETTDGIYFDIAKFPNYGKLSRINLEDQKAGARIEINSEKRNPADFALWKKAEPEHIMQWPSPWGMGYPGWHIECSVMSQRYLGETFDIHSGGVDHIPIHHENEIAQNEALSNQNSVNFWMHGEFMLVDSGKMSKSLGNIYTIKQLEEKGFSALDFRFFCLNAHYRKKLNFTFEGLNAAKIAKERLLNSLYQHKISATKTSPTIISKYKNEFLTAINDDLNVPLALGLLFSMLKEKHSCDIYNLALDFDKIFGLSLDSVTAPQKNEEAIPQQILDLIEQRQLAKADRNFNEADKIRDQIQLLGYALKDTREGTIATKIE